MKKNSVLVLQILPTPNLYYFHFPISTFYTFDFLVFPFFHYFHNAAVSHVSIVLLKSKWTNVLICFKSGCWKAENLEETQGSRGFEPSTLSYRCKVVVLTTWLHIRVRFVSLKQKKGPCKASASSDKHLKALPVLFGLRYFG